MSEQKPIEEFDDAPYADEARQRWGNTPQYAESQRRWKSYSKQEKEALQAKGTELMVRMVGSSAEVQPDDVDIQAAVAEYHAYLNQSFYTCDTEMLRGLAEMWVSDTRFAENYERIRPGGAAFVQQAVNIYCDSLQ